MSVRHRLASNPASERSSVEDVPEKTVKIENALNATPVQLEVVRIAAADEGGLLEKNIRRTAWPKLLGINMFKTSQYTGPPLEKHKDYRQVKLDVDRCIRRIPPSYSSDQATLTQEQTLKLILRILQDNPELHYYQGFHDIVITFIIEVGERVAYEIMNVLVHNHIRDFMDSDMERTKHLISFLPALLSLVDQEVEKFISKSNCNYYFCLSCLITWFGHEVNGHSTIVRLTDLFLSTHPMMSLYLAAAIIIMRRSEILSVSCEMSEVHSVLLHIPEELDWEKAIKKALDLFKAYPPKIVASKKRISYRKSTTFNCYERISKQLSRQLPDHVLQVNPYADQESLLVVPWKGGRVVVKVLLVISPILIGVVYWWWKNGFTLW